MNGSRDVEMGGIGKSRTHVYPHNFSPGRRVVYDLGDSETEREWTPWLVPMIVLANIAMFIVIMFLNNCPKNHNRLLGDCVASFLGRFSFQPLRGNPLFGPSSSTLQKLGALEWDKIIQHKQVWRLVTSAWLHAGVVHLLANMLSLLFIGIRLEQQFGFVRVGIIYFLSGIGGSVLSSLFIQRSISVGASSAVFGLLGAMLSELFTNWTIYTNKAAALVTLIVIIAINLAVGILPHVDNFAHIGGFLTGFLLGFVLLVRPQFGWSQNHRTQLKSKYTIYQYILWITSLILVITGLVLGLVMVFKGVNGNDKCKWCHYLSCVPTSKWNCNN